MAIQEHDLFNNDAGSKYYCGYVDGILNKYYTMITCRDSIPGRFVQILLKGNQQLLNVYEVEVHGI